MIPIDFKEKTMTIGKPESVHPDDCCSLHVQVGEENGFPMLTSCWELDDADIDALIKTRKVWLTILHNVHPMVMVTPVNPQVLQ